MEYMLKEKKENAERKFLWEEILWLKNAEEQ